VPTGTDRSSASPLQTVLAVLPFGFASFSPCRARCLRFAPTPAHGYPIFFTAKKIRGHHTYSSAFFFHPVKLFTTLAKTDLLMLDDFGMAPLNQEQRHDLLEILEDRNSIKSTIVISQLPEENWHEQIGDSTLG
jgi:hypothetical protein